MYSPQQTTSPYTKAGPREPGFPWRLLILTGVLLALTIFIYAGISFGYRPYLEKELSVVQGRLTSASNSLQAQESEVFGVFSQLYNIEKLSKKHVYASKLFTLLEKGTIPSVQFVKANVDISKQPFSFEGIAPNHDAIVTQLAALQGVSGVISVRLVSTQAQENGSVRFSLDLSVVDDYFTQP